MKGPSVPEHTASNLFLYHSAPMFSFWWKDFIMRAPGCFNAAAGVGPTVAPMSVSPISLDFDPQGQTPATSLWYSFRQRK